MTKLQIISDKNKKSSKIKKLLVKKLNQEQFKKDNLIIVIGGDGFMLQTLKKNKSSKKQFYGINSGNYGFLMNKFSSKNIIKNLSKAIILPSSDNAKAIDNVLNPVNVPISKIFLIFEIFIIKCRN